MVSTTPYSGDSPEEISITELPEESGKVNVITLNSKKMEAIYYRSKDSGIHILSEVNGEKYHIEIRTLEGEILVMVEHPNQIATSITIMGHQFLIVNNTLSETERYLTGYAVPEAFSKTITSALKKKRLNLKVLRHLDFEGANNSRDNAMEELLMRPEVVMIEEAARALGGQGIMGNENPAAMPFYVLAMRLTKFRNQFLGTTAVNVAPRVKRGHCWWSFDHCWNNGRCCWTCPRGNSCLGMCGPGCNNCWWWVCGTCCYWEGCYDHDRCCGNWNSWGCQLPIGFNCDLGYWCYSDSTAPFAWG